jgi:hypothetical protein
MHKLMPELIEPPTLWTPRRANNRLIVPTPLPARRSPRCRRHRQRSIRSRYRLPGTYWPAGVAPRMAAEEGQVQEDEEGLVYEDDTGHVVEDGETDETCCCFVTVSCGSLQCDEAAPKFFHLSFEDIEVKTDCINIYDDLFGTFLVAFKMNQSTFSGDFTLEHNPALTITGPPQNQCWWEYIESPATSLSYQGYSGENCTGSAVPMELVCQFWLIDRINVFPNVATIACRLLLRQISDPAMDFNLFGHDVDNPIRTLGDCRGPWTLNNAFTIYSGRRVGKNGTATVSI